MHNSCLRHRFCTKKLACGVSFTYRHLVYWAFDFGGFFSLPNHWYKKGFDYKLSVITSTLVVKIVIKKVSGNNSFLKGVSQQKKWPKPPEMLSSSRY